MRRSKLQVSRLQNHGTTRGGGGGCNASQYACPGRFVYTPSLCSRSLAKERAEVRLLPPHFRPPSPSAVAWVALTERCSNGRGIRVQLQKSGASSATVLQIPRTKHPHWNPLPPLAHCRRHRANANGVLELDTHTSSPCRPSPSGCPPHSSSCPRPGSPCGTTEVRRTHRVSVAIWGGQIQDPHTSQHAHAQHAHGPIPMVTAGASDATAHRHQIERAAPLPGTGPGDQAFGRRCCDRAHRAASTYRQQCDPK